MIHEIMMWLCGFASILGIIFYLLDKFSRKSISKKLSCGLLIGGFLLSVIFGITKPKMENSDKSKSIENQINIENNSNSPISGNIESQTINYFQSNDDKLLDFELDPIIMKMSNNKIRISTSINNKSNLSGTKPKFTIRIYDLPQSKKNKLVSNLYLQNCGKSFQPDPKLFRLNRSMSIYITNDVFSEKILYPKDFINLAVELNVYPSLNLTNYLIARFDCVLKESRMVSKTYLFDISRINGTRILMECDSGSPKVDKLIELYDNLVNEKSMATKNN